MTTQKNSTESEGLHYYVIAVRGGQWLAGFHLFQWAEEWRARYCATGLIVTQEQWLAMQVDEAKKEEAAEASEPRVTPQSHRDWSLLNGQVVGAETTIVSAPTADQLKPTKSERELLRQLREWQEQSARSPIILGVPMKDQP